MPKKNVVSMCLLCGKYFWQEKIKPIELDHSKESGMESIMSGWVCEGCEKGLDENRGAGSDWSEEFQAKYYQE